MSVDKQYVVIILHIGEHDWQAMKYKIQKLHIGILHQMDTFNRVLLIISYRGNTFPLIFFFFLNSLS